jgi:hypothetical protein
MNTSANEGSPMFDCSLKTAILRTASSSLPRRSTSSGTLTVSMPAKFAGSPVQATLYVGVGRRKTGRDTSPGVKEDGVLDG